MSQGEQRQDGPMQSEKAQHFEESIRCLVLVFPRNFFIRQPKTRKHHHTILSRDNFLGRDKWVSRGRISRGIVSKDSV